MTFWRQLSPSRAHKLAGGTAFGMTDVGPVRSSNEDNFLIDETLGLVILGDGMGGHFGGEIASAEALTAVRDHVRAAWHAASEDDDKTIAATPHPRSSAIFDASDPEATWSDQNMPPLLAMYDAVEYANAHLYAQNAAQDRIDGDGMGTTLTGIWHPAAAAPMVVFHVGDSRLYRHRAGALEILTRDQTQYQAALDSGLIDHLPSRNFLLQAVGPTPHVKPDVRSHTVQAGDLYMLCSDGLHGPVPHGEIAAVMSACTMDGMQAACTKLIALAKEYGGRDNITVVMMSCP